MQEVRLAHATVDSHHDFKALLALGLLQPNDRSAYAESKEELASLEKAYRGQFISELKKAALRITGDDEARLTAIPVGLLPTQELNACAVATPMHGAVILLNHGVIAQLMLVCRCAVAFVTWHSDEPFCRDAPQWAYARALIALARYVVTGDSRLLSEHLETLRFPSLSDYDKTTIAFTEMMELYILLHEYGHVIRGHLKESTLRTAFSGRLPDVMEYTKTEREEFEADEYAVTRLIQYGKNGGLRASDVAFSTGLVMKFFELCDNVESILGSLEPRTHPPASERWARIKNISRLSAFPGALAGSLDQAFQAIFDELTPRHI
jgi:hypothetical protein